MSALTTYHRRLDVRRSGLLLALMFAALASALPGSALAAPSRDAVLILEPTVSGGTASREAQAASALGLEVDVVDATAWRAMTASDFAQYRALILGDSGSASPSNYEAASDTAFTWGPVVDGNSVVVGSDPVDHYSSGGHNIVDKGIEYAVNDADHTGVYATLSDAYDAASEGTPVPFLAGLSGGDAFQIRGAHCYEDSHIVIDHPVIDEITDADLSNWGCSVHNTFTSFPDDFVALAIAEGDGDFVAPDGSVGFPYILARGRTTTYAGRNIAALGDSVSAGEGIAEGWVWKPEGEGDGQWEQEGPRFAWDTVFTSGQCHQTPQAHPRVLATELSAAILHLSCTGATADNVLGPFSDRDVDEPQIGSLYDAALPDIVTLSVGANDIRFVDIVIDCIEPHLRLFDNTDCRFDDADLNARFDRQQAGLRRVLEEIQRRGSAAGKVPIVAITQYADPFPLQWSDKCPDLDLPLPGITLSKGEIDFMRGGLKRLNDGIAAVARDFPNAVVVAPPRSFGSHRFCTPEPWTFGPSLVFDKSLDGLHEGWDVGFSKTPFHPTADGQAAIAGRLSGPVATKVAVRSGTNVNVRTPSGPQVRFSGVTLPGGLVADPASVPALPPTASFLLKQAWDITTSAVFNGPAEILLPAGPGDAIWHFTNGAWQKLQTTFSNGFASAFLDHFSPVAVGPDVPDLTARLAAVAPGQAPYEVGFDASASTVADGSTPTSYEWDFGDGETATGPTPSHRFAQSGAYEVRVTVTSADGAVDVASTVVNVTNAAPVAVIDAPASGIVGDRLGFNGERSSDPNGRVGEVTWDFGDGTPPVTGVTVPHAYGAAGTYLVSMRARDDEGQESLAQRTIVIEPRPVQPLLPRFEGKLRLSHTRFRAAARGKSVTKTRRRPPVGTKVSYRLTSAVRVAFVVEQTTRGRKVGKRCVKPTKKNRGRKACKRTVILRGGFTHEGATGPNALKFTGRLGGRTLKPGKYSLVATAGDRRTAGVPLLRTRFTVVR